MSLLNYFIPIALTTVFIILIFGLWNMLKGKSKTRSQTFMRWRVILQFFTVLVIFLVMYFSER